MKRAAVVPADLAGTALDELKDWLAITTTREDAGLTALLRASLETCEAFTGRILLESECEEMLPAGGGTHCLRALPVQSITAVEGISDEGLRFPLPPQDYAIDLLADGTATARVLRATGAARIAVRFTAGIAPDWANLPFALRQGIVRLAAHHYRQRDALEGPVPPASVAALWRPWRRMRLT